MWSLYEFLVTRWPPPPGWPSGRGGAVDLSATSAPSSTRQLAVPTWSQPSRLLPSNSWVQPVPVWAKAPWINMAAPARASAVVIADRRVMVFPPDVSKHFAQRQPLAARLPERADHSPWRTAGKAV